MLAIFLDGESKSGKTAVGRRIRDSLTENGFNVRLIVAGHFFRFLTKLVLDDMPAGTKEVSDEMIRRVLDSPELYGEMPNESRLNSPEIDLWVSRIGQRNFVQEAVNDWRVNAAQKAKDEGIEVVLLDGRNLRRKLDEWVQRAGVITALELIIACRPEVAAERYLRGGNPTHEQLRVVTKQIAERREMDRQRAEAAYVDPAQAVNMRPGSANIDAALEKAWATTTDAPLPIRFDNSDVPLKTGLATMTEVASKSVKRAKLQR